MTDDDFKLIHSPLCQTITEGDISIEVQIFRGADDPAWHLEVVDQRGGSTVWSDTFATDLDALMEVRKTIAEEGIECFLEAPGHKLN